MCPPHRRAIRLVSAAVDMARRARPTSSRFLCLSGGTTCCARGAISGPTHGLLASTRAAYDPPPRHSPPTRRRARPGRCASCGRAASGAAGRAKPVAGPPTRPHLRRLVVVCRTRRPTRPSRHRRRLWTCWRGGADEQDCVPRARHLAACGDVWYTMADSARAGGR